MRFPTMWYVRPAKAQTSLHIRAVWSEPLLVAWIFYDCKATDWTPFGVYKLKRIETAQAWLSLHLSKCHIVGNHMSRLILINFLRYRTGCILLFQKWEKKFLPWNILLFRQHAGSLMRLLHIFQPINKSKALSGNNLSNNVNNNNDCWGFSFTLLCR